MAADNVRDAVRQLAIAGWRHGAVCANCGGALELDGPLGWVHEENRSMCGSDGHAVVPISGTAYAMVR